MQQLQMAWNEEQAVPNTLNIMQSTMPNTNSLEEQQDPWPQYIYNTLVISYIDSLQTQVDIYKHHTTQIHCIVLSYFY